MLLEQRESVTSKIMKYRNGLSRLISTNKLVEELKADLIKLQPVLKKASEETAALLIDLERDQKEANDTAAICARDAQQCKETTRQVQVIKDDCQLDLDEAMPAYEASIKQLDTLKKEHITIIKSFPHPPKPVQRVMEAVCILFGVGTTWDDAKRLLSKVKFLEMCKEYDKDHIPKATMKKLQKYIQDPEFVPSKLESVSEAAVGLCMWVRAMDVYSRVLKAVAPKRKALEAAEATLQQAQETLAAKQLSLRVVEARVAGLQSKYRTKQSERDELQQSIERTKVQLVRAEKLMSGLGSEEKRWDEQAQALNADLSHLVGNIMLSAGCIAYCGPFTASYRQELISDWNRFCVRLSLPVDDHFNLTKTLADPLVVRKWQIMGLPADQHSTENGIFVTRGRRWPLMIDPQSQANRWIKTLGKRDNLQVIRLSDPNYLRVLENAIRYGQPVLLENVEEKLDAAIEPVLQKQIFKKGGQYLLRLNDQDVPFSHEFRLYITTKLSNPSYSAEFFVKVTIINFTVTPKGLEDQLLMVVCSMERADLEQKNDRYIVQISDDRNELAVIEDRILDMLSESKGNILENEQLINALAASKQTSLSITQRMQEAEETLKTIHQVREEYRVVATRASVLYFTVADLARIDPMYQYSLLYFTNLYRQRIAESPANEHLPTRLQTLLKDLVQSIYINICRGLFEKDKLLFSFLIAVQIGRNAGTISEQEWSYFVRGADQPIKNIPPNPVKWLSTATWTDLVNGLPSFVHICDDLKDETKAEAWHKYTTSFSTDQTHVMPDPWQHTLTPFQRLLVLKILRKDRVISGIKDFVYTQLGPRFIKSPPFDLKAVYQSSTPKTPVVFILSPGANPMSYLLRLAREKNMEEQRFRHISLGQGQGAIAQEMMEAGRRDGDWICLQNAHLAASWLPTLEKLLEAHSLSDTHEDYRLFITSMPTEQFPVAILQNSIKIVNEAPKGLANNLMRTFLDIQEEEWEASSQPIAYKKLLFSLAFFHAVLQERRRYGPVGWNIPYEWSASDLDVSKKHLWMYLEESNGTVPWKTLTEIIGGVNYAGRVTDDKDQRCVYSLLSRCFTPELLTTENFPLSESGTYYCPPAGKLSAVREYIASLPDDVPEVFGLHQNADVTFQLNETRTLLETVVAIQPRASVGTSSNASAGATSQDAIVLELAGSLETRLPALLDRKYAHVTTFADIETGGNTLGVFLGQEMDRFNKLLTVIRSTLVDLQRAIRGVFVMSGELEAMFSCLLYNQVPARWERHAYPSMKALGSWFDDLIERVSFMDNWLRNGPPTAFWLSGFFFPQGFLTGVLQKYARQTHTPIDTLRFQSHVMKTMDPKQAKAPEKGALIYGLHLQGASFDVDKSVVVESAPGVLFVNMPLIWLEPVSVDEPVPSLTYLCPTYKTSKRAGVLATTGHSTNFVLNLHLSTEVEPDHWIRRGVAMLLSLD